jgi:peptidyl-prolyl cis-trans isomerase-like protein 2
VYAYDTVQELNKKPKLYQDLVTNEPFTLNDIITIQDPKKSKEVESFDYLKNNLPFVPP